MPPHGARVLSKGNNMLNAKKLICKYCKVEVVSKTDLRAVLGKEHKKCCPRKRLN